MSFERIKTVNGKQYKYLVKNVRKDGKVKQEIIEYYGRVDKDKIQGEKENNGTPIPYGVYYFYQDNCQYCMRESDKKYFDDVIDLADNVPNIQYVDIHDNDINIVCENTPFIIDISNKEMYVNEGQMCAFKWIQWKIGEEEYNRISSILCQNRNDKLKLEILDKVREGKKIRELSKIYPEKKFLIRECIEEVKQEKKDKKNCKNGTCKVDLSKMN